MPDTRNIIIIGSGPAGYTAAVYAARANLKPTMISGAEIGGQLMTTTEVENYPGFPKGVMGPEMMTLFREQAARFGTEFIDTIVIEVDFSKRPFTVKTPSDTFTAHAVIVSTGASARWLDLPGEHELRTGGKGLTACATCDGFFYRGKEVVVMGGGDSAMEEATFLTKFCTKVTIINRRDQFRASKIMLDRAKHNEKIAFKTPYAISGYTSRTAEPARPRTTQPPASSWPSATSQTRSSSRACSRPMRAATSSPARRSATPAIPQARPALTACSRAATRRTTSTGRPSRRRGQAAWPRLMPSAGSRRRASRGKERTRRRVRCIKTEGSRQR
jgi:thioredoxin reductase